MARKRLPAIHPGEILLEELLKLMGISQYRIAKDINVPARRINEIVHGKKEQRGQAKGTKGDKGDRQIMLYSYGT